MKITITLIIVVGIFAASISLRLFSRPALMSNDSGTNRAHLESMTPKEILEALSGRVEDSVGSGSAVPDTTYGRAVAVANSCVTVEFFDGSGGTHLLDGKRVTFAFSNWGTDAETGVSGISVGDMVRVDWWSSGGEDDLMHGMHVSKAEESSELSGALRARAAEVDCSLAE